jgi:hypothetical protein
VIDTEEEDDNPRPVSATAANVAATSLIDRTGEEESAM